MVGSHLLMQLLQNGQEVKALCRPGSDLDKVLALFESYGPQTAHLFSKITWVEGDLNNLPSLVEAFTEVTEVYHCAALISFDPKDRLLLRQINHIGTQNIVNLCLEKNIKRLYYCSSSATIGGIKNPVTEKDEWDFTASNVYATSKYLAEMEVWRGGQEGLETIIINPGVIFGPGFWNQGSGQFFSKVANGIKYSPPGGTGFVGVWDVVRAFEAIAEHGGFNQRYILVAGNLDYAAVLALIAGVLNVPGPNKKLKFWQLEWLWRLDAFRALLTPGSRKLTRATAQNLRRPKRYSSEKISALSGFRFEPIEAVIRRCGDHFPSPIQRSQS